MKQQDGIMSEILNSNPPKIIGNFTTLEFNSGTAFK
jgi:hypothetical protein